MAISGYEILEVMKEAGVPGLSIATFRDGKLDRCEGFGIKSVDTQEPVTEDTVFEVASLSKPAFATLALQLVDDGLLSLDEPLSTYLPHFMSQSEPRLNQVTARMALSHSSGLPHTRQPGAPIVFNAEPGASFGYSGTGIYYLQAVVQHLTRRPFSELMQERVLGPCGMASSSFEWRDSYEQGAATGHMKDGRPGPSGNARYRQLTEEKRREFHAEYPDYLSPSATVGLTATARDYALFMLAALSSRDRPGILTPSMAREMLTLQVKVNEDVSWGLGWGLEETSKGRAFWHWGTGSYSAILPSPFQRKVQALLS